jgi:hypothetical protein
MRLSVTPAEQTGRILGSAGGTIVLRFPHCTTYDSLSLSTLTIIFGSLRIAHLVSGVLNESK